MGQETGRKEMSVHPPYSTSPKVPFFDKFENLAMTSGNDAREGVKIAQHARAIF